MPEERVVPVEKTYTPPQTVRRSTQVLTSSIDTGLDEPEKKGSSAPRTPVPQLQEDVQSFPRPDDASLTPFSSPLEPVSTDEHLPKDTIEPVLAPELPTLDPVSPAPIPPAIPQGPRKLFSQEAPPAIMALESSIEGKYLSRNYGDAAAEVERAIRIQPKNPELWHALAEIRLRQGQWDTAEDLAKKSNTLAKNHPDLIKNNWRVIAESRRKRGDGIGAQEALGKAW